MRGTSTGTDDNSRERAGARGGEAATLAGGARRERAVRTALQLQRMMAEFRRQLGREELTVGIGRIGVEMKLP